MKSILSKIFSLIGTYDVNTIEVLKKALSSSAVKVAGIAAGFIISIFLGNLLGPSGLGEINLLKRISTILTMVGLFGLPQYLIKEIAILYDRNDWNEIGSIMQSAFLTLLVTILVIFIVTLPLVNIISENVFNIDSFTFPLTLSIIMIIPMIYSRVYSAGLVGIRNIWQSNLATESLTNYFMLLIVGVYVAYRMELEVLDVIFYFLFSRFVVLLLMSLLWRNKSKGSHSKFALNIGLFKKSFPFFLISSSAVLNTNVDVILLGIYSNTYELGLYTVAIQISLLTNIILQVIGASIAPKIASMYQKGEIIQLKIMTNRITMLLIFTSVVMYIFFVLFGRPMLSIWGETFKESYIYLLILGFGQLVNLSTGTVGYLLIMTGYEKLQTKISAIFLLINVILNIVLIYYFDVLGAAIATSLTVALDNLTRAYFVRRKLSINIIF